MCKDLHQHTYLYLYLSIHSSIRLALYNYEFTQIPPIAVRLDRVSPRLVPSVSAGNLYFITTTVCSWTLTPPSVTKLPSKSQKPPQLLTSCLLTPNPSSAWPHQSCQPPKLQRSSQYAHLRPGGPATSCRLTPLLVQPRHPPRTDHILHPSPICPVRGRGIKKRSPQTFKGSPCQIAERAYNP